MSTVTSSLMIVQLPSSMSVRTNQISDLSPQRHPNFFLQTEASDNDAPRPSVADVLACSFPAWHPLFRHCSIRGSSVQLSADFLSYLRAPGSLVLPSCSSEQPPPHDSGSDDEDFELRLGPDPEPASSLRFPELEAEIARCLSRFGGAVFPKLNWSAPRDAAWINFCKSLKCAAPSDVYLLLKSSERIAHDLLAAFSHCSDPALAPAEPELHLVLKKWCELRPEREVRAFVRHRRLLAVCQRHRLGSKNAAFLAEHREDLLDSLVAFFNREVRDKFPRDDFVLDAYWQPNDDWMIIDFNPFGLPTDPRLFSWPELLDPKLMQNGVTRPQLRIEDNDGAGIVPQDMEVYGLPIDMIDLATGSDPHKFMDLLRESVRRQRDEESSSSGEES